nr:protein FAR1-RELATED SEQUENCE 5-like [Ipomoea trifida]
MPQCLHTGEASWLVLPSGGQSVYATILPVVQVDMDRLQMFSQIIKEHKDMLLSYPGCCSSVVGKRSIIEAICGSFVPSEVSVLPPKKAKNKGSGKRIKGFKEIAIEETGVVRSSVVVCCVRFGVVSVDGPVGVLNSSLITFCCGLLAVDFVAVLWTRLITLSTSSGVIPKLKLGPSAILVLYCSLLAIALSISSKAAMNSGLFQNSSFS